MSYWVEDRNGYVGDLATTFGLRRLRLRGPKALRDFLKRGGAVTDDELRRVVEACRTSAVRSVRSAGRLLARAHAPVMVTDGEQTTTAAPITEDRFMTTNSIPKLLDALRPNLPKIAEWLNAPVGTAQMWRQGTHRPKPEVSARLVRHTRKHAQELLDLAERVEREDKERAAKLTRRGYVRKHSRKGGN